VVDAYKEPVGEHTGAELDALAARAAAGWTERRAVWNRPAPRDKAGVLAKYARLARPASEGAVTT
jgi:hypothetical protein